MQEGFIITNAEARSGQVLVVVKKDNHGFAEGSHMIGWINQNLGFSAEIEG